MAQHALARAVVERRDVQAPCQGADGGQDGVGLFVLQQAVFHRHQPMGAGFIGAADHRAPGPFGKGGLYLTAIVKGMFHAQDGQYRSQAA